MNTLLEKRRYADVIRVYDKFIEVMRKNNVEKANYFELFGLITEALMEKVPDAFLFSS